MKYTLWFICFFYLPINLFAQTPTEKELKKHAEKVQKSREKGKNISSLDTLFASGKPFCKMKGIKKSFLGTTEYSITPLKTQDEVIYLQFIGEGPAGNQTFYWDMSFLTENKKIRFAQGTNLENTIVDYKLLTDSSLNIAGMNKLLLVKGQKPVNVPVVPVIVQQPTQIERNRSGMIQIFGSNIMQGGVLIGTITQQSVTEAGELFYQMTISLPTGELIATAKNEGITDHTWTIITAKDNNSHSISSSIGKDMADVVKYLIDHLYL